MERWWKCELGETEWDLGNLKYRSGSHGQMHNNFDNYNVLGDRDDACKSCEESCGVVELVQAMLVLTRVYKLILCIVRDERTITT